MKRLIVKYTIKIGILSFIIQIMLGTYIYYMLKGEIANKVIDLSEQSIILGIIYDSINSSMIMWVPLLTAFICAISILIFNRISTPSEKLAEHIEEISKYDFSREVELKKGWELKNLIELLNKAKLELSKIILEEKKLIDKLLIATGDILREVEKKQINKEKVKKLLKDLTDDLDQLQIISTKYKPRKKAIE